MCPEAHNHLRSSIPLTQSDFEGVLKWKPDGQTPWLKYTKTKIVLDKIFSLSRQFWAKEPRSFGKYCKPKRCCFYRIVERLLCRTPHLYSFSTVFWIIPRLRSAPSVQKLWVRESTFKSSRLCKILLFRSSLVKEAKTKSSLAADRGLPPAPAPLPPSSPPPLPPSPAAPGTPPMLRVVESLPLGLARLGPCRGDKPFAIIAVLDLRTVEPLVGSEALEGVLQRCTPSMML